MAVRASMQSLIGRLRLLIGDASSAEPTSARDEVGAQVPVWTDEELQERLDRRRDRVRYEPLTAYPDYGPGGVVNWREFRARRGDWEEDAQIVDASFPPVQDLDADYLTGTWTSPVNRTLLPLYVSGRVYDLAGAAADTCEAWAAALKAAVDISDSGASLKRSQQVQALLDLARRYRERQWPLTIAMTRPDVGADEWERGARSHRAGALL